jgi:ABC-type sulfate transport system substrate-binding protein
MQAYGQPSAVPVVANNEQHGEEGGDKKVQNMAKKFGKNVGVAATWGFGATCKYNKNHCIFSLNY